MGAVDSHDLLRLARLFDGQRQSTSWGRKQAVLTFAVLAVLSQLVVVAAAAVEVGGGELDAVMLTAAITDRAGEDSWGDRKQSRDWLGK